jgi:hypothetical protein
MAGNSGVCKLLQEKKKDLFAVFKNGFKDTSRLKLLYEEE